MLFRLLPDVQVMAAPPEKREDLLTDLQKFAFMGIPDIRLTQHGQVCP